MHTIFLCLLQYVCLFSQTVGELKIVMISQMQVEGVQEGGRLRIDDDHSGVGVPCKLQFSHCAVWGLFHYMLVY